jgi:hypothetical protein
MFVTEVAEPLTTPGVVSAHAVAAHAIETTNDIRTIFRISTLLYETTGRGSVTAAER